LIKGARQIQQGHTAKTGGKRMFGGSQRARRAAVLAGASTLALATGSARALAAVAPAPASDSATVTEIVVTAQKREEKVNSVPMSITAVTGQRFSMRMNRNRGVRVRRSDSVSYLGLGVGKVV
jgi:outer membrane receptor protein involved in Fe transport